MRTIGVVTTSRADYGYYRPILTRIKSDSELSLRIFAAGMHLSANYGNTIQQILDDGFEVAEKVDMLLSSGTTEAVAKSIGLGIIGFAQAFSRTQFDILLLLGDRFEMLAAGLAALPMAKPIAHIAGGESSEGQIDEAARHSLTKMSHLHFVSTAHYRRRVIQMGEEPSRVFLTGAPTLDNLRSVKFPSVDELEQRVAMSLRAPFLLATFHPVTLQFQDTLGQVQAFLSALHFSNMPVVFTGTNADTANHFIFQEISNYVGSHTNARMVPSLGTPAYFGLMKEATAMVGNSSSGIIEAASFGLPVVNVGARQRGRIHGLNVIDVPCESNAIVSAIKTACSSDFVHSVKGIENPYGDGAASERIVECLKNVRIDNEFLLKRFHEIAQAPG